MAIKHYVEVEDWHTIRAGTSPEDAFHATSGYVDPGENINPVQTKFGSLSYDQTMTLKQENAYYKAKETYLRAVEGVRRNVCVTWTVATDGGDGTT